MVTVKAIIFSFLFTAAICAPLKGNEESVTLFHGEDFHILLSSLEIEVSFKNRSDPRKPLMLMRGRKEINSRATLNEGSSHLIIENVGEGDEGLYIVKNPKNPDDIKQYSLIVRDCTREQVIKYGGSFSIPLQGVNPPIILEYRPSAVEANQTSGPAFVLLTAAGSLTEPYQERINVSERYVTLRGVTGADEGSYTVRDNKGFIQKKVCLNVIEHAKHVTLVYGEKLKINLILNSSLVQLFYTPSTIGSSTHLLLDKGEFTSALTELKLEDRLSLEGSVVILDQAKDKDSGLFKITDLRGFTVSTIQLRLEPRKLEPLFVAIIAMLGLLTFLLLACLLSCLIKVNKRAKRAAALEKLAQNAGKEDEGEAFRQVVKNITKLSEESKHSQADNTEKSQSTEVDIKGLEVSSKEVGGGNLETSDSGVGFNTALPLDTDTDAPDQIPDSEAASISVPPETKPSPPSAPESKPAASPATEVKPSSVPETKVSPVPETKKTPDQLKKEKLDAPKPADSKGSSSPSPEPKAGLSPADAKPAPSPSPEPKTGLSPADPKPASSPSPEPKVPPATTPTPESKSTSTPTKDPAKPTSAEPITNGTPEPGPDAKASPDHADIIKGSAPKEVSPKTHEVELKSSVSEGHKDGSAAEDSTTT